MWSTMWDWHRGNGRSRQTSSADLDELMVALRDGSEPEALHAGYELATLGARAVAPLMAAFREGADRLAEELAQYEGAGVHGAIGRHRVSSASRNAAYALAATGAPAVPALRDAMHDDVEAVRALAAGTFAEMGRAGRESVPDLVNATNDESMSVRRQAAEALGMVGAGSSAVPALIDALGDEGGGVRRSVALTLARVGPEAEEAVPALVRALRDPDKYVRGKAAHALQRINTAEAHEALLRFLVAFRWA
jgi:HEAT repeat protein